jgi:hypothetical protein
MRPDIYSLGEDGSADPFQSSAQITEDRQSRSCPAHRQERSRLPAGGVGKETTRQGAHTPVPREKTKKERADGPVGGILAHPTEEGGSGEWAESGRELGRGRRKSAQGCSFSLVLFLSEFLFSLNILYFQIHVWF